MRKFMDEIIFSVGIFVAYTLMVFIQALQYISLIGSLVSIVLTAIYFSFTFFRSKELGIKFVYFLLLVVLIIGYFSLVYNAYGIINTSTGEIETGNWLNSIYFSVVTWTTLGYGDFQPIDDLKVWVMVEALMGYIFMGLIVGKVLFLSQPQKSDDGT